MVIPLFCCITSALLRKIWASGIHNHLMVIPLLARSALEKKHGHQVENHLMVIPLFFCTTPAS